MPDTATKPPVIVAVEEPSEEEPALADPPAAEAPSEVDEVEGSRFPEWAIIPSWRAPAGFPAGRSVYFLPMIVSKMARRDGGGLAAAMAAETAATVRGFLDPETARRVGRFG